MENKPMISSVRIDKFEKEPSMGFADHFVFLRAAMWVLKEKVAIEEAFVNVFLFDVVSCEILLVKAEGFHLSSGLSIWFSFVKPPFEDQSQTAPRPAMTCLEPVSGCPRLTVTCPRLAETFPGLPLTSSVEPITLPRTKRSTHGRRIF
jgi:hypothetical protein